MHIGQWLVTAGAKTVKVRSPWFPRGADNAVFTYEEIETVGAPSFGVSVFHRSVDDTGNGVAATGEGSGWSAVSGSNFKYRRYNGLKEMVRFEFELSGETETMDAVLYRMLAPTWFDKVAA
ncbi:MAG: hypothetical protein IPK26_20790 [Planctomycetes bacterium]|nr:hypothetical protein [Planctomycetota bacterium]